MSKVITFSTKFPAKHPKAGEPTLFVEKIMAGLADGREGWLMLDSFGSYDFHTYYNCTAPKFHTIRGGNRWKVGDTFSPRIWSGKPYASKQLSFSCDIEIVKVWNVRLEITDDIAFTFWIDGVNVPTDEVVRLAKNDGLEINDFFNWLSANMKKGETVFTGQILCWDNRVKYGAAKLIAATPA